MPKKRICIVNAFYPPVIPGGAEISVSELAQELNQDHEVLVICSNTSNRYLEEIIDGVRVSRVPAMNVLFWNPPKNLFLRLLWHLLRPLRLIRVIYIKRTILRFQPDIVHLNNLQCLYFHLAPWLRKKGIKCLHTARDLLPICRWMMIRDTKPCTQQCSQCKIRNYRIRKSMQALDASVGISHAITNKFLETQYYQPEKTTVIYNSVGDLGHLSPPDSSSYDIGFMGGMSENKGIQLFLQIARERPQYRFCIATQSGQNVIDSYKNQIPENVTLLNKVSQTTFFSQIRICIVPSLVAEAFGRVAAESLSAARPVLVSDRGGLPEIVRDGVDGYVLSPYSDVSEWLAKVDRLVQDTDLYQKMATSGRQRYVENFTRKQVKENYSALYQKLLADQ